MISIQKLEYDSTPHVQEAIQILVHMENGGILGWQWSGLVD